MSINLNTGSVQVPVAPHSYPNMGQTAFKKEEYVDTTASEMTIFPSEHRRIIVVEPHKMTIITGYNLDDETKITFRKILRSSGVPAHGSNGCCPVVTVGHATRLHSVEIPCWTITKDAPIFILKTPGNYELDVVGNNINVVATAMTFDIQDVNELSCCLCKPQEEQKPVEVVITNGTVEVR